MEEKRGKKERKKLTGPMIENNVSDLLRCRCGRCALLGRWGGEDGQVDGRVDGRGDPVRADRAAALTGMNESQKQSLGGNLQRGAAGVPDTLLPLTGLMLRAAA